MFRKKVLISAIIIMCVTGAASYAAEYSSAHFVLREAKVVISGGCACSANYMLLSVEIGNMFGGRAESDNYSLDTKSIDVKYGPNSPTHRPLKDPTNIPIQLLCGTKDRATSIYIDGYEAIPVDEYTDWDCDLYLVEGLNTVILTSRDEEGLESESALFSVTLDTIPPAILIDEPIRGAVVTGPVIEVKGTIDGWPFFRNEGLRQGINEVVVEARDEAENESIEEIRVYRARRPIRPPRSK